MKLLKRNSILVLAILIMLFFDTGLSFAVSLTINQALEVGLKNNSNLKDLEQQIKSNEMNIISIEAGQDWSINLNTNYNLIEKNSKVNNLTSEDLGIGFNKEYSSGLSLNPKIDFDTENYHPDYIIDLSYKLYPQIPIESDKNLYKQRKNQEKLKQKLKEEKINQLVSWINNYLNLVRLQEKESIYLKRVDLSQQELEKIELKKEIGEASKVDLLTAQLDLEQNNYNLTDIRQKFKESKKEFY